MGFRDDREANVQRIETLERDLAATKNELEAAALRAAEVDDLRKRVVTLTQERDELRKGVEPAWAAKHQRLASWTGVGVILIAAIGVAGGYVVNRSRAEQNARVARAEADLASCEYTSEPIRRERDAAREELRQIDGAHSAEIQRMQQLLNAARMNETGGALLLSGHVVERSGAVPEGALGHCVMAVRELSGHSCAAAVMCGGRQVFPFNEPPPDVVCSGPGGTAWRVGDSMPLDRVVGAVADIPQPQLRYDASSRTLEVRETGSPTFALRISVDDVTPFHVR